MLLSSWSACSFRCRFAPARLAELQQQSQALFCTPITLILLFLLLSFFLDECCHPLDLFAICLFSSSPNKLNTQGRRQHPLGYSAVFWLLMWEEFKCKHLTGFQNRMNDQKIYLGFLLKNILRLNNETPVSPFSTFPFTTQLWVSLPEPNGLQPHAHGQGRGTEAQTPCATNSERNQEAHFGLLGESVICVQTWCKLLSDFVTWFF